MWRPSELHAFLAEQGLSAKKGLSQHFLIDRHVIERMIALAELQPGDSVLEIGPGPGAITQRLLDHGAQVLAIEKDAQFARLLSRFDSTGERLRVAHADALTYPLSELQGAVVVANLPFQVASPILTRFVTEPERIKRMVVLIQDEVARRLLASPFSREISSLTLFMQMYAQVRRGIRVKRTCFSPPPAVDGAVVVIDPHPPHIAHPEECLQVIRQAFQQRRKMLSTSLGQQYGKEAIQQALEQVGASPKARPEELNLTQWIALYKELI